METKVRILKKNVGELPETVEIEIGNDYGLRPLQEIVGGYIEALGVEDGLTLLLNEEGKIHGLKPHLFLREIDDVVVGNVALVAYDEEGDLRSLTDDELKTAASQLARWTI